MEDGEDEAALSGGPRLMVGKMEGARLLDEEIEAGWPTERCLLWWWWWWCLRMEAWEERENRGVSVEREMRSGEEECGGVACETLRGKE